MSKKEELNLAQAIKDALEDAFSIQEKMNEAKVRANDLEIKKLDIAKKQRVLEVKSKQWQDDIKKGQEELKKLKEKQIENERVYNALLEEAAGNAKEIAEINQARLEEEKDLLDDIKKTKDELVERNSDLVQSQREIEKAIKDTADAEKELKKVAEETTEEFQKQQQMAAGLGKAFGTLGAKLPGSLGKWFSFMKKASKFIDKHQQKISDIMKPRMVKGAQKASNWWTNSKGVRSIGKGLDGLAKKGGKVGKVGKVMSGAFGRIGPMLARLGPALASFSATGIGAIVLAIIAVVAAAGLMMIALIKLAIQIDNVSKKIAAATGYVSDFHGEILRITSANIMAGVTFEAVGEAYMAMADGLSSFLPQSKKANEYMATNIALLKKFGVSAQQSVKAMDYMQRGMGLNSKQAADLAANVARMGKEVGITAKKAMEDFNRVAPTLARYGKDNIKVFKELQSVAKATGLSIDTLTNSVSKFDTFEGAASSAANLNAVLGTSISHLDMMNMNEAERVLHIKAQVSARVGDFDSLDKFTKMHIAQAMGLKSVDEAQRMLNMSSSEYADTLAGQKESANIQKEMAQAAEGLVTLGDQLKLMFTQILLGAEPLIDALTLVVKGVSFIIPPMAKLMALVFKGLSPFLALAAAVTVFSSAIVALPLAAPIALFAALGKTFDFMYGIFSSVINPPFIRVFHFLAEGLHLMLTPLRMVMKFIDKMSDKFLNFLLILTGNADQIGNLNGKKDKFDIQALMEMDTSKVNSGLKTIRDNVAAIGEVDMSGLLLAKPDGTVIFGGENLIDSISDGRLHISVDVPEPKQSIVNTIVKIGETELKKLIEGVTAETVSGAA